MIHPQDSHVGPSARPPLLDLLSGCVEDFHERDGARGNAPRGTHPAALGPEAGKGETCASA